jgi:hypothetical protein
MLGTKYVLPFVRLLALMDLMHRYNIEPFFTSSINRIPSRYQEAFSQGKGDRKSNIYILESRLMCATRHYYYPAIHTNSTAGARATIIHFSNTIPLNSDR